MSEMFTQQRKYIQFAQRNRKAKLLYTTQAPMHARALMHTPAIYIASKSSVLRMCQV